MFHNTRDCVAFWAIPDFYGGIVCHRFVMKRGSRAGFVLSSLWHRLRPEAFLLLNRLRFLLLPSVTNALERPAFWCVERLSGGPVPDVDCFSVIVGSVSVMPYCSSDMLVRFTAWGIYPDDEYDQFHTVRADCSLREHSVSLEHRSTLLLMFDVSGSNPGPESDSPKLRVVCTDLPVGCGRLL